MPEIEKNEIHYKHAKFSPAVLEDIAEFLDTVHVSFDKEDIKALCADNLEFMRVRKTLDCRSLPRWGFKLSEVIISERLVIAVWGDHVDEFSKSMRRVVCFSFNVDGNITTTSDKTQAKEMTSQDMAEILAKYSLEVSDLRITAKIDSESYTNFNTVKKLACPKTKK